jgi:cytoskeleton protein RodZ
MTVEKNRQGTVKMTKSDNSVSELLKSARNKQGLSLSEVAQETCISICYLKAIEAGSYHELPAQTFTIGFIRSYADVLGLDSGAIVAQYKNQCSIIEPLELNETKSANSNKLSSMRPSRRKGWLAPAMAAVGVACVWSFWGANVAVQTMVAENTNSQNSNLLVNVSPEMVVSDQDQAIDVGTNTIHATYVSENISPVNSVEIDQTAAQNVSLGASDSFSEKFDAAPIQSGLATPQNNEKQSLFASPVFAEPVDTEVLSNDVTIIAKHDSWVRLARADGSEVWSGILSAGEHFNPNLEAGVLFSTSNAGAVHLAVGSYESAPLGELGEVIPATSLDSLRRWNLTE